MGDLPSFDFESPPLTETVIGVQFDEMYELTPAHFGWYWKEHLQGWPAPREVPPITDAFEDFPRGARSSGIVFNFAAEPTRMQFHTPDGGEMIQVQRSRFICNWMQTDGSKAYPRWGTLLARFQEHFTAFCDTLAKAGLPAPRVNQWEVVYVNTIPKGDIWSSPSDWSRIFPSLFVAGSGGAGTLPMSGFGGHWVYDILPDRGRLHAEVQHRYGVPLGGEVLAFQLTARGAVGDGDFLPGLELGHSTIIQAFVDLTHPDAHRRWGRRK